MNEELRLHIKKLQSRSFLSFIAILLIILSIGFGILFLFIPSLFSIIFFLIAVACVLYLIHIVQIVKKESTKSIFKPVTFHADKPFSFEEIIAVFESLSDQENQLSTSADARFFRLNKIFKLRVILYRTSDFDKNDYDNAKDRINKKANKDLNISHWTNRSEAVKKMRFNIVFTDTLNDALYQLISQNATRNLTRVEGIINIAIVGNQILIPPIYGDCDLAEINRYKGVIKFINQIILKPKAVSAHGTHLTRRRID